MKEWQGAAGKAGSRKAKAEIEIKVEHLACRTPWLVQVCNLYPRTENNNRMIELMNNRIKVKAEIKAEPGLKRLSQIEAIDQRTTLHNRQSSIINHQSGALGWCRFVTCTRERDKALRHS